MRILVFSWKDMSHPHAGGAEVYTHEVARHWVQMGHKVTLFTATFPGSTLDDERDGVRIVRRSGRRGIYGSLFWEARRYYASDGRGNFDLVIDQINTRPFWCPTFVDDTPVVALAHQVAREVWYYEAPLPIALLGRFFFEPRWLKRYRDVTTITVSESSKRSLERYGLRRVSVIPEGFTEPPATHRVSAREERPTVIYVGRLSRNKRPHHAIRAFRHLRKTIPDVQLWVVGTGPMEARLRRQATDGVTFFGKVNEDKKFELMARAHLLVMASVREGWGLTVTEAASVGTPTVAYDVDGLRDSVRASGGVLTEISTTALGQGMANVLRSPHETAPVAPNGVLSWREVASAILRLAPCAASVEPYVCSAQSNLLAPDTPQ